LECRKEYPHEWIRDEVFADKIPHCVECSGVVKPDIVFFGESLPERFHQCVKQDMPQCDLLIVMGTSLVVQPFASLVDRVPETTPRLLINKEKCGQEVNFFSMLFGMPSGFQFDSDDNYRDVMWQGTTDDGCIALADLLGWKDELLKLVKTDHRKLNNAASTSDSKDAGGSGHKKEDENSVKDSAQKKRDPSKTVPSKNSPAKGVSPKSTPEKRTSPKNIPGKSTSPKRLPEKSTSPKRTPEKSTSPKRTSEKSTSPKKTPEKSTSPKNIPGKSTSPKGAPAKSPTKESK